MNVFVLAVDIILKERYNNKDIIIDINRSELNLKRISILCLAVILLCTCLPVSAATIKEGGAQIVLHANSSWHIADGEWTPSTHVIEMDENKNLFISINDFRAFFKCKLTYSYEDFSIFVQHEGREIWQALNTPVMFVDNIPYPNPAPYISPDGGDVMIPAEPYASVFGYKGEFVSLPSYAPGQLNLTLPQREYKITHIDVNKTMQLVTVCGTDELGATVPLKYFLCSTGNPVSLTPNGTFYARPLSYTSAQNPWYYFSLHNCWVLYCTQISGNICFHSLTFNQYGANSLSQSAYKALGNPASHGCIRLLVEDAKFIWENCRGIPVHISDGFYDETLNSIKSQLQLARPSYNEYVSSLVNNY